MQRAQGKYRYSYLGLIPDGVLCSKCGREFSTKKNMKTHKELVCLGNRKSENTEEEIQEIRSTLVTCLEELGKIRSLLECLLTE